MTGGGNETFTAGNQDGWSFSTTAAVVAVGKLWIELNY